jgi:hypothetical protein
MDLQGCAPEILREMLLRDEEAGLAQRRRLCEGQREGDVNLAPVGSSPLAREIETRECANALGRKALAIRFSVLRTHHQHCEAFAARQKAADEIGERIITGLDARRNELLPETDQLEKSAIELNDVVFCTPGVAIARPDLKTKPPVQGGLRRKIMRGYDQVIDGARHSDSD